MTVKSTKQATYTYHFSAEEFDGLTQSRDMRIELPNGKVLRIVGIDDTKTSTNPAKENPFCPSSFIPMEGLKEEGIPDNYFEGDIEAYMKVKRLILQNELTEMMATLRQMETTDEMLHEIEAYREYHNVWFPERSKNVVKPPF